MYKLTSPAETRKNQFYASFYVFHSKNSKNSSVDVSPPEIFFLLHSLWSISTQWNVVYFLMRHTANLFRDD